MIKKFLAYLNLMLFIPIFAQTNFVGQMITLKNDTVNVQIETEEFGANFNRLVYLQKGIRVINKNLVTVYHANEIKSFKINIDRKIYTFDSVDKEFFAQRMYASKLRVYKYYETIIDSSRLTPVTANIKMYIIKKPNEDKSFFVRANRLIGWLIPKEFILSIVTGCQDAYNKIESDRIKIKNEDDLIEFIKDYEKNCFAN